jgi:hypothetical protein
MISNELNYIAVVQEDLDKFFATKFIAPVEEATLLSPIVVVPKKMGSLKFAWISKN